jgi:phosphoribosylanthranilate isomerase
VDAPAGDVLQVVEHVGLDVVQLHGSERVDDYGGLPVRLIKAVSLDADADVARAAALPAHVTVLVDAADPVSRGGTGRVADWTRAAALARARPIMLAGGLSPENAAGAVEAVRPWALDVSSGVESAPGIKDHGKLTRLFAALRSVDVEGE